MNLTVSKKKKKKRLELLIHLQKQGLNAKLGYLTKIKKRNLGTLKTIYKISVDFF